MTAATLTTEALRKLLDTGDEVDRCYAARTLGILRDQDASGQLVERLQDEDLDVCIDAAEALGKIGAKSAVPALIHTLSSDPSGEVCATIAEALGKIGSPEAIEALCKIALERPEQMEWNSDWDSWWDVQLEAVKALGSLGSEAAVDILLQILDDDEQQDIESAILASLANIPGKGVSTLSERLQGADTPTLAKRRICRALPLAPGKEGIRALGRALQDSEAEIRAAAASALALVDAPRYTKALLLLLRDPSHEVRESALKAIFTLSQNNRPTKETVDELLPALEGPSGEVPSTLITMLANSVQPVDLSASQIESVLKSLNDASAETAAAACTLLGKNGDPLTLPALFELLRYQGGHPMVRRQAALAVGNIGQLSEEILGILTTCVGDHQQPVRLGALSALMLLEKNAAKDQAELQRPLDIIISAVNGDIEVAPMRKRVMQTTPSEPTPEQDRATDAGLVDDAPADPQVADGAKAEDTNQKPPPLPDAPTDGTQPTVIKPLELPETPAQIVERGEVKTAASTLDAIAMDNIEVALNLHQHEEQTPDLDEVTEEYLAVVEENKETMRRIQSERHIQPKQDVRRLGARILAECEEPTAISSLIQVLSDDDSLLRREAADAIGQIGARNPKIPQLMNAVGILITQLTMGDMLQKVTCARALSFLGNKAALHPLTCALKDPEANVRVQAIDALARLVIQGADPREADHMVVIELSPLSIARKLLDCLKDAQMAVRVATARALATLVPSLNESHFEDRVTTAIIASAPLWTGEEARPLGRCLRSFDTEQCTEKLLKSLDEAENSIERSVYIEMLEELLNPEFGPSEQAA